MPTLIAHDFSVEVLPATADQLAYIVTGLVTCPSDGWMLTLEPDNEGPIADPTLAVLRLSAQAPETGPPVVVEEPVEYRGSDDPALEMIEIRLDGDIETPDGAKSIILYTKVRAGS